MDKYYEYFCLRFNFFSYRDGLYPYKRKLDKFAFFAFGILLILYPYMVDSLTLTVVVGAVFIIAPFVASRVSE